MVNVNSIERDKQQIIKNFNPEGCCPLFKFNLDFGLI